MRGVAFATIVAVTLSLVLLAGREDSAARRCPDARREVARAGGLTLFHETHTDGNLAGVEGRPADVTFAQFAGLHERLRCGLRDPEASLFLGNGDDLSPELNGRRTDGRHVVDAFNAAQLDVDTFGMSEVHLYVETGDGFDEGISQLRRLVSRSRFQWVSANVRDGADPDRVLAYEQGARRFVVRRVAGIRVGITGLLGRPTRQSIPAVPPEVAETVRVMEPARALRQLVSEMRAAGARLVILLSHVIHADTRRVLRSVDGVDVAIGTHLGLPLVEPEQVGGALLAVAGPDELQALGQLDLTVRDGRSLRYRFHRHVPSPAGPAEAAVEAALERYLPRGQLTRPTTPVPALVRRAHFPAQRGLLGQGPPDGGMVLDHTVHLAVPGQDELESEPESVQRRVGRAEPSNVIPFAADRRLRRSWSYLTAFEAMSSPNNFACSWTSEWRPTLISRAVRSLPARYDPPGRGGRGQWRPSGGKLGTMQT